MAAVSNHSSLDVIRAEHRALSAVLQSMQMLLARSRRLGRPPEFDVLRAMLLYVDEFPERLHHPKESAVLFPMLRSHAPEIGGVLDELDAQHAAGERAIRELEHALLAYEVLGESRRAAFERGLEEYVLSYLDHMSVEEARVLPAALRALSAAQWQEVDEAFAANRDPLTGHEPSAEYEALFAAIAHDAPAPIGFADACLGKGS